MVAQRNTNLLVESKSKRLRKLLEHFVAPDEDTNEDMRTYIEPEKTKGNANSSAASHPRMEPIAKTFSESSLKTLSETTPMPRCRDTSPVTTTAIVRIDDSSVVTKSYSLTSRREPDGSSEDNALKLTGTKYRSHERHHFVKINASSFVSCSSPTGVYSELAFVLWISNTDNKNYNRYTATSDRYRVVLSLLYDSEDDLWCVSAKLIKRVSFYSVKDEEEGQISNRLCRADELRSEIKKMLLYLGISPREAYRLFRRNMEENVLISDSNAGFITAETESHTRLMKELDKGSSQNWSNHGSNSHGYNYDTIRNGQHQNHNTHHNFASLNKSEDKHDSAVYSMYGGGDYAD